VLLVATLGSIIRYPFEETVCSRHCSLSVDSLIGRLVGCMLHGTAISEAAGAGSFSKSETPQQCDATSSSDLGQSGHFTNGTTILSLQVKPIFRRTGQSRIKMSFRVAVCSTFIFSVSKYVYVTHFYQCPFLPM